MSVANAVATSLNTGEPTLISEYQPSDQCSISEFVVFFKPSIISAVTHGNYGALEFCCNKFRTWHVEAVASLAIPGAYIRDRSIIRAHYGAIDRVSREGLLALPVPDRDKLLQTAEANGWRSILGGHQFLQAYPQIEPTRLTQLFAASQVSRVASGAHGSVVQVNGESVLVLNGFHPEQVSIYESDSAAILVLVCRSESSWSDLRRKMIGATNPLNAAKGSIRADLNANSHKWDIAPVTSLRNGIHMSAGPVEAIAELSRFMPDSLARRQVRPEDTTFGRVLATQFGSQAVQRLSQNAPIRLGVEVEGDAFDVTEEMEPSEFLRLAKQQGLTFR